ncbi:DUF1330 domain-containing protein [Actibacterium sp. 188UL27-1]|uniref:DUF1330 domain-containing protein n=1 Tax=Actibacterium sp. 188UL27-1 TaxID=2786961 RepID=UPI0019586FFF|nr:DUF1330 domain-containing protein [Actibacterium sp. 188UL27-1]MBM7069837.1 DUF1330 domain-containing protein [Actibacterium sp. 188UL27-1]
MPKGYWVVAMDATDQVAVADILRQLSYTISEHNGAILAESDNGPPRGPDPEERVVVVEFATLDDARTCMDSPAFIRTRQMRDAIPSLRIVVIEQAGF